MNKELKELKDEIKKINKSNKIKAFKIDCQKVLLDYKKLKNTQSKTKLRKTGNEIGTTCCLECKTYTHNFKPQELKMTNMIQKVNQKFNFSFLVTDVIKESGDLLRKVQEKALKI